jgi:hypothetical protein
MGPAINQSSFIRLVCLSLHINKYLSVNIQEYAIGPVGILVLNNNNNSECPWYIPHRIFPHPETSPRKLASPFENPGQVYGNIFT